MEDPLGCHFRDLSSPCTIPSSQVCPIVRVRIVVTSFGPSPFKTTTLEVQLMGNTSGTFEEGIRHESAVGRIFPVVAMTNEQNEGLSSHFTYVHDL